MFSNNIFFFHSWCIYFAPSSPTWNTDLVFVFFPLSSLAECRGTEAEKKKSKKTGADVSEVAQQQNRQEGLTSGAKTIIVSPTLRKI